MSEKKVLVLLPVTDVHKEKLESAAGGTVFTYCQPEQLTSDIVEAAQVIIGNLPVDFVGACTRLEWMQSNFAGLGKWSDPGFLPDRVLLTNGSGAYGEAIGEYLTALLLSLMKKFPLYRDQQREKRWADLGPVSTIMGSHVLVVGLGDIGCAFARRIDALGGRVTGIRRSPGAPPQGVSEVYAMERLDALLPQADVVALCLPDTPLTRGLMTGERLRRMKKGAFFLNVGRGNVVDHVALAEALTSGHLAAAAMDVFDPEPLPAESPLWPIPTMMITPHVAGQFHLGDILEKVVAISCENLRRFMAGQTLLNLVDKEAGYRRKEDHWTP